MPHFCFVFEPSQAGCVERIAAFSPWSQPVQGPGGKMMDPATAAWYALQQFGSHLNQWNQPTLAFPQGVLPKVTCIAPGGAGNAFNVWCIQKAEPAAGRVTTSAPYGSPVASNQSFAPPPTISKERVVPQGMYEDLTDCALASSNDSVLGEMDAAGGTYSDLDSQGREVPRQIMAPYSPKVAGR